MIEYTIKDVLKIILKKWYLVLIFVVFFVIISYPVSKISYDRALENYNNLNEVEGNINSSNNIISGYEVSIVLNDQTLYETNKDLEHDVKLICKNTNGYDKNLIILEYYRSINTLVIKNDGMSEENFNQYISYLKDNFNTKLAGIATFNFEDVSNTTLKEDQENEFRNSIIKKPNEFIFSIKTAIKAGIVGFIIAIILIMILDYIKVCKKIRK